MLPGPFELKSGDMGGEAVDAEDHFPRSLSLGPPRSAHQFPVVLPDSPSRVHREPDVGLTLVARAEGDQEVAREELSIPISISNSFSSSSSSFFDLCRGDSGSGKNSKRWGER